MADSDRSGDGRTTARVAFGWCSLQGRRRANEDFVAFRAGTPRQLADHGVVVAIADGVGGHKGGRVAAELAVRGFLDGQAAQSPLLGIRAGAARALAPVNRWVHAIGRTDPALDRMATTLTALILHGRTAHVVHVGDSRLYRLRDGLLVRLTTDHVSDRPGLGHVLTRAVGLEDDLAIAYAAEPMQPHDRYLLCTDGLHGVMDDAAIGRALGEGDPAHAAMRLAEAALAARSADNVTAAVIEVEALPGITGDELAASLATLRLVPDPQPGQAVDGFRLERALQRGRDARVFLATDTIGGLGEVVLKVPVLAGPEALRRVLREEWIGLHVRSPWLAAAVELPAERRQSLYGVQRYHAGETLEQRLRRPPRLSLPDGLQIGIRLAKAVAALHRAGVIHRDIKPDNVQLEAGGGLRLLDLGVARLAALDDADDGDAAAILARAPGTASFMAPELIDGRSDGDARTDLFALGVTLYRAWTGTFPYGEVEPFQRKSFGRPAPLGTHRPDLPSWLGAVLERAVAVRPEDRPQDAIELLFALEHGAERPGPTPRGRVPLLSRDPARFWRAVSLLLAVALLAVALSHADR